jgi:hypothetical protein
MERTYVRCYGFFVASGVSRIIISEGKDGANSRSLLRILRGIRREPDHFFGRGKMERTHVRCYGFFVASGVSRIIFSEGEDGANSRSLLRIYLRHN